ncbi:MAG: WYL domain-containing protein, partial [Rhodospirillales bacterium]
MNIRARQDALVRHLRRSGHTNIDSLARAVGASRRTVLRDVVALRDQGFVIHAEAGRGGGLFLDPSSVQLTPRLTADEVFALLINVAVMRAAGTLPFGGLADAGLAKIERALPPDRVKALREIVDRLYIGPPAWPRLRASLGPVDPGLLPAFERAFIDLRRMLFDYVDRHGAPSSREIEPQALLVRPPVWYIVGFDPLRDDFRNFRMDRIRGAELVEDGRFRRRAVHFEDNICLASWTGPV